LSCIAPSTIGARTTGRNWNDPITPLSIAEG